MSLNVSTDVERKLNFICFISYHKISLREVLFDTCIWCVYFMYMVYVYFTFTENEPLKVFKPSEWVESKSSPVRFTGSVAEAKSSGIYLVYAQVTNNWFLIDF